MGILDPSHQLILDSNREPPIFFLHEGQALAPCQELLHFLT